MTRFLQEFRAFALRGNVIDLAVGVIIGIAFNAVVTSFVNDILMQLIASIFGQPDFTALTWGPVSIGAFLTAIVNFVIVAFALFVMVKAINRMRRPSGEAESPTTRACPFCVTNIPNNATRCPACTSEIEPLARA